MALTLTNEDRAQILQILDYLHLGHDDSKGGFAEVVVDPQVLSDLNITGYTPPAAKKMPSPGSNQFRA